ncbi:MAG: hypothetical protein AAF993_08195 [Pseudomonadota bacterium]
MIDEPAQTLSDLAQRLATRLLPDLQTTYSQADAALISGLMLGLAQDYERAVDNRMRDINEINEIFRSLGNEVPGAVERSAFMDQAPSSLHLTDVNTLHAQGMELLIQLHAWAESADDTLNRQIWQLLHRHCERNRFDITGG